MFQVISASGITGSTGARHDHPLIRHEQAARSFVVKALKQLGLNDEPLRRPGRPLVEEPVPYGIIIDDGDEDEREQENSN